MTKITTAPATRDLTYRGITIVTRGEMLSLTDMWRAAGAEDGKRPARWMETQAVQEFVEVLRASVNIAQGHIIQTGRGRLGSTLAHWQIGLAYAKYLSPEFHMWCNAVVRGRMEGHRATGGGITLQDMDAHVRQVLGGIAKSVVNKALDEKLIPILARLETLVSDPEAAVVVNYRPMLDVLKDMGIGPERRRPLSQRLATGCRRWCIRNNRGSDVRSSRETERLIFHVDAIAPFMAEEGNSILANHRAVLAGQGVLPFRPRKHKQPELLDRKAPETPDGKDPSA